MKLISQQIGAKFRVLAYKLSNIFQGLIPRIPLPGEGTPHQPNPFPRSAISPLRIPGSATESQFKAISFILMRTVSDKEDL